MELKIKFHSIKADIYFLKECKSKKVFPNFIRVKCAIMNSRSNKVIEASRRKWLNLERKHLHAKLSDIELQLYNVHLLITKNLSNSDSVKWLVKMREINDEVEIKTKTKQETLNRKFQKLIDNKPVNRRKPTVLTVPNYVNNLSSIQFTEQELGLLNKGLNFTPTPNKPDIESAIVDIETSIKYLRDIDKEIIRKAVRPVIKNVLIAPKRRQTIKTDLSITSDLKTKDVFYLKADKGNKMVIMDKTEYRRRMNNLIADSSFKVLKRNPLQGMINKSKDLIDAIEEGLEIPKWKLKVHNPQLPLLYGQPKIHKPGDKMRPVIASYTSPMYKIAQWVVQEFNNLKPPPSRSIKNVYEFADLIQEIQLEHDDILVSFDVTSLYPNVPIPEALQLINDWLFESNISNTKADLLYKATKLCMEQNFFQYNGIFYKQTFGANMGNPLSCFVADTLMGALENLLTKNSLLPNTWIRYVDDVFAVVKRSEIENLKNAVNNGHPYETIKFTSEEEIDGKLPFLDLMLTRRNQKIEIGIYRKPTHTQRFITRDSYCPRSTKIAAFNSMVYRMCKLPLPINNFIKELTTIKEIANTNGYTNNEIDDLVMKHSRNIKKNSLSTLFKQAKNQKITTRVPFKFTHAITNHLKPIFKQHGMSIVFANNNKLKSALGNPKDKCDDHHQKSGIYQILCGFCSKLYIGQSRRRILTRYKEHCAHIKFNRPTKSAVAEHAISNLHVNITDSNLKNLKLLKESRSIRQLDILESIEIHKNKSKLMNNVYGPVSSSLFNFIKQNT